MRNFLVKVGHFSASVEEQEIGTPHWVCVVDGEKWCYRIEKQENLSRVANWYERGTIEVQYHAKNTSKTGIVLWQQMPKREPRQNAKKKLIQSKMRRLL